MTTTQRKGHRRALFWALSHGASADLAATFAEAYADLLDELPANQIPDRPAPTPAEFADENVLEYGSLVDVSPIGTVVEVKGLWAARCTSCGWPPSTVSATSYAAAEHAAAVHNSDVHTPGRRPQWGEVAEWIAAHQTGASA